MADFWSLGAGEIRYERQTPILKALLPLINQDASEGKIYYQSEMGYPYEWSDEDLQERLFEACDEYGLDVSAAQDLEGAACTAFLLESLYYHACNTQGRQVDDSIVLEIRRIAEEGDCEQIPVDDVLRWMHILDDGHGVSFARASGAYGADRLVQHGVFGGTFFLDSPRVHYFQSTHSIGADIESLEAALNRSDMELAALSMKSYMLRALGSIQDPAVRDVVWEKAAQAIGEALAQENRADMARLSTQANEDCEDLGDVPY